MAGPDRPLTDGERQRDARAPSGVCMRGVDRSPATIRAACLSAVVSVLRTIRSAGPRSVVVWAQSALSSTNQPSRNVFICQTGMCAADAITPSMRLGKSSATNSPTAPPPEQPHVESRALVCRSA